MPLTRVGSLLPYHTHVDPETVASALNRMIDEAARGRTVFYRFYSEAERRQEPTRDNTGLFFFRGRPGAPFAVISPGGGFSYVGSVHEGFPYAEAISGKGLNAFVLKYRAGHGEAVATQDLAAAVAYIFRNAGTLGVSTTGYSLWGSSAGARMAAAIGSHGVASYGGDDVPQPSAIVMAYTAHSDHAAAEPPTFVVVGEQDGIAPPRSWGGGSRPCARPAPRSSTASTRAWGMASGSARARAPRDGSSTPSGSGRRRSGGLRRRRGNPAGSPRPDVVGEQQVLVAQVEPAVRDDGVRPRRLAAAARLLEAPALEIRLRARLDQQHRAVLGAVVEPAVREGHRALRRLSSLGALVPVDRASPKVEGQEEAARVAAVRAVERAVDQDHAAVVVLHLVGEVDLLGLDTPVGRTSVASPGRRPCRRPRPRRPRRRGAAASRC